jgi:peptide/nickel transport system substrate-binding protein
MEFDPEAARQRLEDAGYRDTDGDGIREMPNGGRPLRFRYFVRSENNDTVKASQFITDWLRDIGIETEIESLTDTKLTEVLYEGNFDIFHWGWFPDPDPDFILSVMTCGQRPPQGSWSDSFYCNEEYDRMYQQQKTITDTEERAGVIKEMQRMVYLVSPYAVLYYDANLQAFRSDRWTGFQMQPEKTGDLVSGYGNYTWVTLRPLTAGAAQSSAQGIPPGVWIGIIAGIVVLGGIFLLMRRRTAVEERA